MSFLRYPTGESGMVVELFSRRPYIKILFCRFTIYHFPFSEPRKFLGKFPEISWKFLGKLPEISRKIPLPPIYPPIYPPYPSPHLIYNIHPPSPLTPPYIPNPFSRKCKSNVFRRFFPTTFICIRIRTVCTVCIYRNLLVLSQFNMNTILDRYCMVQYNS